MTPQLQLLAPSCTTMPAAAPRFRIIRSRVSLIVADSMLQLLACCHNSGRIQYSSEPVCLVLVPDSSVKGLAYLLRRALGRSSCHS